MTKPFLLFASPRAGSTPVYKLILRHLSMTQEVNGLGEPFNITYYPEWDQTGRFYKRFEIQKRRSIKSIGDEISATERILKYRLAAILVNPEKLFLKVFSNHLVESIIVPLQKNFDWIFLERKNLYGQLLSYLISTYTSLWYADHGINLKPGSLPAHRKSFEQFETIIWNYQVLKKSSKPTRVAVYEDFRALEPGSFLKSLGFPEIPDLTDFQLPAIQNRGNKEEVFVNPREIKNWYRDSFLEDLFPLEKI